MAATSLNRGTTDWPSDPRQPWRTAGTFSNHWLMHRLPAAGSALWAEAGGAAADNAFAAILAQYRANVAGLRTGNEEDCEDRFLSPVLMALGFGFANRKAIPGTDVRSLPDYVLFARQDDADVLFATGAAAGWYARAIGLLEAKRWGLNLSQAEGGTSSAKKTPHQQTRDYLADAPSIGWAILSNGARWRLYAKRERSSSFFEFDLESVLALADSDETEARRQFRWFWALFARSAFTPGAAGRCRLDDALDDSIQYRVEVERRLREQVFDCVEILGQGFLDTIDNGLGTGDVGAIYDHALILLYRILFVLNAEARGLLPTTGATPAEQQYVASYSLHHVRQQLQSPQAAMAFHDAGTFTLWERLRSLFRLINGVPTTRGVDRNAELGIPRYNGGLFDPDRWPFLEAKKVGDAPLAAVIALLSHRAEPDGAVTTFDYASLGERHLGSIYEGLLEHRFVLDGATAPGGALRVRLVNDKGVRKALGAYYTPEPWVAYIVGHTVGPLLAALGKEGPHRPAPSPNAGGWGASEVSDGVEPDDSFAEAVLRLNVCDPAMGSGHFLVEAVNVLAEAAAAHPTTRPRAPAGAGGGEVGAPSAEATLAYWKRRIVEACIYGVDVNPLGVELAKLSLWLTTVDRVPLNFLDHHLRCGNSLLGTWLDALPQFRAPKAERGAATPRTPADGVTGDAGNPVANAAASRTTATKAAKATKLGPRGEVQLPLTFHADLGAALRDVIAGIHAIEGAATDSQEAAKAKEARWREIADVLLPPFRAVADLWMAPWFGVALNGDAFADALSQPKSAALALRSSHASALDSRRFFHWELEFPDVFFNESGHRRPDGGFDAVVGNPPWERMNLEENEFFAARDPAIAKAPTGAERKRRIAALVNVNPALWAEYEAAVEDIDAQRYFLAGSGLYPLCGRGRTNTYAVFAERALALLNPTGRAGLLVPSGIATDHNTQHFFQKLVTERRLSELLDFENRRKIFEDVDSRFKFSIIEMSGAAAPQSTVRSGFFLHSMDDLADADRTFELRPDDFARFNPNTLTCPIFRRRRDYELTAQIYDRVPVLVNKGQGDAGNPWGLRFRQGLFNMTSDSHLFRTARELEDAGFWLGAGNVFTKGVERFVPLYEGKMVQMYDHRAASVVVNTENVHRPAQPVATAGAEYARHDFSPLPQYWVSTAAVRERVGSPEPPWWVGIKEITAPTNERTVIAAGLPAVGFGNKVLLFRLPPDRASFATCLLANLNALVFDFATRQKIGGQTLNFFIVEQLPILPPSTYDTPFHGTRLADIIIPRVLELTYTAHDMRGFAEAVGYAGEPFVWDEERRLHLKCQLDALYFHLYGLTRAEADEVLATFPIVRRQDEARWGRWRTRELVLGYYNAFGAGNLDAVVKA